MGNITTDYLHLHNIVQIALREDVPAGFQISQEVDTHDVDNLPLIVHYEYGESSPTAQLGLWPFSLQINAFGLTADDAHAAAAAAYKAITGWKQTRLVPDLGGVRFRNFSGNFFWIRQPAKALIGKPVRQLMGTFQMNGFHPDLFS